MWTAPEAYEPEQVRTGPVGAIGLLALNFSTKTSAQLEYLL